MHDAWGAELSAALRTPEGAAAGAELRPVQTAALLDVAAGRADGTGCVLQGRIGCGKSLFLMLAPVMAGAERPLLAMPGGMLRPFRAMMWEMRKHWQIPTGLVLASYEQISRLPAAGQTLADLCGGQWPDFFGADEAHFLANVGPAGSGRANQINDVLVARPDIRVVVCTGTLDVHGFRGYSHFFEWALRGRSPVPSLPSEVESWARVLDDGDDSDPSLLAFVARALGAPAATVAACRAAFRRRLRDWPGVVVKDDPFTGVPLIIRTWSPPGLGEATRAHEGAADRAGDPELVPHFERLRTLHQRPDGEDVLDAASAPADGGVGADWAPEPDRIDGPIWTVARRMARGLCYLYDPRPPPEWREARRAYGRAVRRMRESGEAYTELQARQFAEAHPTSGIGMALAAWRAAAAAFPGPPREVAAWLSTRTLRAAEDWGRTYTGLIFVDDVAFGRALALQTGWTYYGEEGRAAGAGGGRYIEDHPRRGQPGHGTAIASRQANGTGRNLQHIWHRALFVTGTANKAHAEQNVGRLMREGQTLPVHIDWLCICPEDFRAQHAILAGMQATNETSYDLTIAHATWASIATLDPTP